MDMGLAAVNNKPETEVGRVLYNQSFGVIQKDPKKGLRDTFLLLNHMWLSSIFDLVHDLFSGGGV